jgi:NitT/TauT family transport system ATP-binding protein
MSQAATSGSASTAAGPPTGRRLLTLRGLGKKFDNGLRAIDTLDLDVAQGEFVSLVGPSGCGKSTVLRIASGLDRPTSGEIEVGTDHIGYVFQDPTLLPWRTVQQNVELCNQLRRVSKAQRAAKARAAIEMVGLAGFEGRYPNQLSGGMRMRTSLARALTLDPELSLFDEPFGAIDEITRERLNGELLRIFLATGFAAVFVTHSIAEAVFMSTRVVVLSSRPGRIVGEFDVPFGYPRAPELRADPGFAALGGEIGRCLRGGAR